MAPVTNTRSPGCAPDRDTVRPLGVQPSALYHHVASKQELLAAVAARLEELAAFTDARAAETGRDDFAEHAALEHWLGCDRLVQVT